MMIVMTATSELTCAHLVTQSKTPNRSFADNVTVVKEVDSAAFIADMLAGTHMIVHGATLSQDRKGIRRSSENDGNLACVLHIKS